MIRCTADSPAPVQLRGCHLKNSNNHHVSMKISEIKVSKRCRQDLGDIPGLAKSIQETGLLHPIVITPAGELIAGRRRLEAIKSLGWEETPVNVVDLKEIIKGEFAENIIRKDFTPSEMVAIKRAIEPDIREAAKERQKEHGGTAPGKSGNTCADSAQVKGKARDKVSQFLKVGRTKLKEAEEIVKAAETKPKEFSDLVEKMDRSGNVHAAHKELKNRLKRDEHKKLAEQFEAETPPDNRWKLIHTDFRNAQLEAESIDAVITDPPYPHEYLPLYESLAAFNYRVLKPGGSLLVMVGQSYLPEIISTLAKHLRYNWTICYLTPGPATPIWQRRINTSWKPVLWFVKDEYKGIWVGDVCKSDYSDKRFHEWGQSEGGMADVVKRFTKPGDLILDPFCGAGTTGVVALQLKRRFIGIDNDKGSIEIAKGRILKELSNGNAG